MIDLVIAARPRDLGGIPVGRVLPAVAKRSVGPFVFLDHMGPADAGIGVRPHPHINLATVTYLLDGAIVHRDSLGSHQTITPGAVNWMSAGRGIVHSERGTEPVHGLQLWVALPRAAEDTDPWFHHHPAESLPEATDAGVHARVLAGEAFGLSSPVRTASPMVYLDAQLEAGARFEVPDYSERAVYVVDGAAVVGERRIGPRQLGVLARGMAVVRAEAATRLVVIGGEPLDGPRYIWWNFVSSSRQRIVDAWEAWRDAKFPLVPGDEVERIPAPAEPPHFRPDPHHNPPDDELRALLVAAKTIAMVGASNDPAKPSHGIMQRLLAAGYHVIPVNPHETEVLGQKAVASLADIHEPVDIVDVFRRSEDTPPIADAAIALGAKALWLQLGVTNEDTAERAAAAGLAVVMNRCIGATHKALGIPPKASRNV